MNDDKSNAILTRLLQAEKILDEAIKTKPKDMIKDGFSTGASQINTLRSWTTDKDDKNPLIRTMSYSSSGFPYLAKNNDELKKFPKSLLAKARNEKGELTEMNLKDARLKGKVRVSRNAVKWWFENGKPCSDEVLKAVKFINSVGIRKVNEYNQVSFDTVTTGRKALTRRRVQTEVPVIDIIGRRGLFFSGVFEGNLDTLGLSESDKSNIATINTEILDLIQDPDDVVRTVSSLTDRKVKYIPLNEVYNTSLIEMRHAIESERWQIIPTNVPRSINRQNDILKVTCGLLIHYALQAGGAAKRTLIEMLERTFLANESLAFMLRENETTPNMMMAVCQAALGKPIPQFKQFMGVTFVRTKFTRYLSALHPSNKIRMDGTDEIRGKKLVIYYVKNIEKYRSNLTNNAVEFTYTKGYSEYHIRYSSSSAEAKIYNDVLESITFQTKNRLDLIHMMAATITQFTLWKEETVFPNMEFKAGSPLNIKDKIFQYFKNPHLWPFTKTVEHRLKLPHEIQIRDVPIYKEVFVCDVEATSYGDIDFNCDVDDTTLEVKAKDKFGYGVESYEPIFIYADSIRMSANATAKSHKTFPAEIFSVHPVLVTRLGTDQKVFMFFIECFNIFVKYPNYKKCLFELGEEVVKNLEVQFIITEKEYKKLSDFLEFTEPRLFPSDFRSTFSCVIARVLISNFFNSKNNRAAFTLGYRDNELKVVHPFFTASLPGLDIGRAVVNYDDVFKVGNDAIFNLRTKQMLIGSNYFEYPILKICENEVEHEQLKGIPISALKNQVGKHVLLVGQCYTVESIEGKRPIQEIVEDIQNKQTTIQDYDWGLLQDESSDSELSENDFEDMDVEV